MDNFCILPFTHISTNASGSTKACCLNTDILRFPNGSKGDLSKHTLEDIWHNSDITKLRDEFLRNERPEGCKKCWDEEAVGRKSKRQVANAQFEAVVADAKQGKLQVKYLELVLGNTCNLKCRICSPHSSSKWIKEHLDVYKTSDGISDFASLEFGKWEDNDSFWDFIYENCSTIERIDFYGGEPFLVNRHYDFLQYLIDNDYAGNIEINYHTNGTVMHKKLDVLENFKNVNIAFSLDGTEERFKYLRHPGDWNLVKSNIEKYLEYQAPGYGQRAPGKFIHFTICPTVCNLNIYYFDEMFKFAKDMNISIWVNLLHWPTEYSIKLLPPKVKEMLTEKYNAILEAKLYTDVVDDSMIRDFINFMNSEDCSDQLETFFAKVEKHDIYRKELYADTFPEFWDIIKEYKE